MRRYPICLLAGLFTLLVPPSSIGAQKGATGLIDSIENAPIVFNGDVSGQPLDVLITLDSSLDPGVGGLNLMAGAAIKLYFPDEFDLGNIDPAYPLLDVPFADANTPCIPGDLRCSTVILLRGWPQDPFFPPSAFARLSVDESDNALVITAQQDIGSVPGIKQIHLILNGVRNPGAGSYRLRIEAESGPSGALETGEGLIRIRRRAERSINPTAVFVKALSGQLDGGVACGPGTLPPNPDNPIYQSTSISTKAPFAWSFIVWDRDGEPMDDLELRRIGRSLYSLVRAPEDSGRPTTLGRRKTVGFVHLETPPGARFTSLEQIDCPRSIPATPVIGATPGIGPQPAGRVDLQFTAGDKPGVYRATFWLKDGNRVEMVVRAE